MQRAHKRKIKVLVVDAAMMFAAVQMTVCMHPRCACAIEYIEVTPDKNKK